MCRRSRPRAAPSSVLRASQRAPARAHPAAPRVAAPAPRARAHSPQARSGRAAPPPMGRGGAAFDKVKLLVGIEPEPASVIDELDQACTLSRKQRLIGFAVCLVVGLFLNIVSWFVIFKPMAFAVLFTIGNIVSLCSTAFLCGPKKQFKNMTDRTRMLTTIVYVVFMILTLVSALKWKSKIGTVICCIVQYGALTWYTLSYIPFARALVKKILGSAVPSVGA